MFPFRLKRKPAAKPDAAPAAQRRRRIDPDALLRRLEWTVIRRLDGLLQGDYRTLLRGFGLDFADLREYQPHDDVRYIDWNVTARTQVPYVREFQEDREIAAWFLLDLTGSVNFGSREAKKSELSAQLVAVLARLLTRYGNRVGALLYAGGTPQVIPARGGRMQVLNIVDAMQRIEPPPKANETDLTDLLRKAEQVIRMPSAPIASDRERTLHATPSSSLLVDVLGFWRPAARDAAAAGVVPRPRRLVRLRLRHDGT